MSKWFLILTLLVLSSLAQAKVRPTITCANKNANYNISPNTSSNNVPLFQCYANVKGECQYNFVTPFNITSWGQSFTNACPNPPAGTDCCGWKQTAQKLCCNLNTGLTVPASPRGCTNGQALTQVASGAECIQLCIKNGGPGGNGNTSNCGH